MLCWLGLQLLPFSLNCTEIKQNESSEWLIHASYITCKSAVFTYKGKSAVFTYTRPMCGNQPPKGAQGSSLLILMTLLTCFQQCTSVGPYAQERKAEIKKWQPVTMEIVNKRSFWLAHIFSLSCLSQPLWENQLHLFEKSHREVHVTRNGGLLPTATWVTWKWILLLHSCF